MWWSFCGGAAPTRRRPIRSVSIETQSHHYILRVGVVGEGAVVEHDLVEGLGTDLSNL